MKILKVGDDTIFKKKYNLLKKDTDNGVTYNG
jgi:hypothetical protein